MNPPKCQASHTALAALKCYTAQRSSVSHLRGLSQLPRRTVFSVFSKWKGIQLCKVTNRMARRTANPCMKKGPEKGRGSTLVTHRRLPLIGLCAPPSRHAFLGLCFKISQKAIIL